MLTGPLFNIGTYAGGWSAHDPDGHVMAVEYSHPFGGFFLRRFLLLAIKTFCAGLVANIILFRAALVSELFNKHWYLLCVRNTPDLHKFA